MLPPGRPAIIRAMDQIELNSAPAAPAGMSVDRGAPQATDAPLSLSRHAGAGAILAAGIGALWVAHYLVTTQYGYTLFGTSIFQYVIGISHGIGEKAAEALFVVVTRFLLAFGLAWGPLTLLIALVSRR